MQCAIEVQRELDGVTAPEGAALRFRIGVHLGDVLVDGDDLLGEGVNLAARLQTMAEPGGVLISQQVYDQVQKKLSVGFEYLGEKRPKNFAEDVAVYRIGPSRGDGAPAPAVRAPHRPPEGLRARLARIAKIQAGILVLLVAANVATGSAPWAHWFALIMATWLAWHGAPLFAHGRALTLLRAGIVIVVLALINAFTWNGSVWFLWPAGLIAFVVLLRRLTRKKA